MEIEYNETARDFILINGNKSLSVSIDTLSDAYYSHYKGEVNSGSFIGEFKDYILDYDLVLHFIQNFFK